MKHTRRGHVHRYHIKNPQLDRDTGCVICGKQGGWMVGYKNALHAHPACMNKLASEKGKEPKQ